MFYSNFKRSRKKTPKNKERKKPKTLVACILGLAGGDLLKFGMWTAIPGGQPLPAHSVLLL